MKTLLLVDDDLLFCETLARAMARRHFDVRTAQTQEAALELAGTLTPELVLLDLKMQQGSGLALIPRLLAIDPYTRIVVLTGYASVATAVEAIKLGAVHYLCKPVEVDEIISAFSRTEGDPDTPIAGGPRTINEVEWEHIRSALARNQGNISATARELKMHRRSLQRKIDKMPV